MPVARKFCKLIKEYRPAYCLSFWEPAVAIFINVLNCPTKLVAVASDFEASAFGERFRTDASGFYAACRQRLALEPSVLMPAGTLLASGMRAARVPFVPRYGRLD